MILVGCQYSTHINVGVIKTVLCLLFGGLTIGVTMAQTVDTLIDVGTHRLHFRIVKGISSPILFEAGGGDNATIWAKQVVPVHQQTGATLIMYDRAGIGQSEIDTTRINLINEVEELEIALKKLGYFEQLVIVAHSFGGTYATFLSERNQDVVKGVVFVDCNLACFNTAATAKYLTDSYQDRMAALKTQSIGTYYSLLHYQESNALFRRVSFPASIPATVISSEVAPFTGPLGVRWKACQQQFGRASNHHYVLAKGSGHYIHRDKPKLVNDEIVSLYKQVIEP